MQKVPLILRGKESRVRGSEAFLEMDFGVLQLLQKYALPGTQPEGISPRMATVIDNFVSVLMACPVLNMIYLYAYSNPEREVML